MDPQRRRAALIASAVAVPVTVLLALALAVDNGTDTTPSSSSGAGAQPSVLPPIVVTAPPSDASTAAPCTQVLRALPVQLGPLAPRTVTPNPDSPFVTAWGDPAVVLRCGVNRPAKLVPGSADVVVLVGGVNWLPDQHTDDTVFVSIDRAVYVEVSVPRRASFQPLPILGAAIASKLPAVCTVPEPATPAPPTSTLCTRRR